MNNLVAAAKSSKTVSRIRDIRDRAVAALATAWLSLYMTGLRVYATTNTTTKDADALWTEVAGQIEKWVLRLGGVVMFVGLIQFGLGWQRDDAEGKSRGIQTIIAGAIVMAAGGMASVFFA